MTFYFEEDVYGDIVTGEGDESPIYDVYGDY